MSTARELINGALRLIGQIAEGETPSNETYSDSLSALNQMLESWSVDRLNVYALQDQQITWPANEVTQEFGATGDLTGERPIALDHAYIVVDGSSYPLTLLTKEQYDDITTKEVTATQPWCLYAAMNVPDIALYVYPVPTAATEMHLVSIDPLTEPATLATELVLPPGYLRAFRYNLALELSAEFGKAPANSVSVNAQKALATIQRNNTPLDTLRMPFGMPGGASGPYDINQG